MPIGLIRLISTQKVLKTCINKGVKNHFLGSNQHLYINLRLKRLQSSQPNTPKKTRVSPPFG